MGKQLDLDSPLSEEDKQYLRDRGRGYLIPANERRFGADGTRTPEPHEYTGATAQSPFYDTEERDKAVYDVGGAPLPGTILNHDTGRVLDRDNGMEVEFTGPGHTPGGYDLRIGYEPEGFVSGSTVDADGKVIVDEDQFDEDITEYVTDLNVTELKDELKEHGIQFSSELKKDGLRDRLIVFYQDARNNGAEITFVEEEEDEKK